MVNTKTIACKQNEQNQHVNTETDSMRHVMPRLRLTAASAMKQFAWQAQWLKLHNLWIGMTIYKGQWSWGTHIKFKNTLW